MEYVVVVIISVILGAGIVLVINWLRGCEAKTIAQELIAQAESDRIQDT